MVPELAMNQPSITKRGLIVLVVCFFTLFTSFAIRYSYGILLPEMLPSLEISRTEAGLIYSSFFVAYTVFSPVVGLLADRIDVRALFVLFLPIFGIGTFLMAYSSSLVEASFFFALAGVGTSVCWSPIVTLAQRWISDRRRGIALAFITSGSPVGIAVSSLTIPWIVLTFNWRIAWKILGILVFFLTCVNFFFIRKNPMHSDNVRPQKTSRHGEYPVTSMYLKILGYSRLLLVMLFRRS